MTLAVVNVCSIDRLPSLDAQKCLEDELPASERVASRVTRVARSVTRRLLGTALDIAPAAVPISRTCTRCGHPDHGRPRVLGEHPISFSVSHSGERVLIAYTAAEVALGVDIEVIRRRARLRALAARALNDDEYATWARTAAGEQLTLFLRMWTAKEAYLKATGVGIATALRAVTPRPAGWTNDALDVGPDAVAALAVALPAVAVERQAWSGLQAE